MPPFCAIRPTFCGTLAEYLRNTRDGTAIMRFFFPFPIDTILSADSSLGRWTIGKFLVLAGAGLMLGILGLTFMAIHHAMSVRLDEAFARNAQLRAFAQADTITRLLDDAVLELEYLSRGPLTAERILSHLNAKAVEERGRYAEVAFQGTAKDEFFILVNNGDAFVALPPGQFQSGGGIFAAIGAGPPRGRDRDREIRAGEPAEAAYVALPAEEGVRNLAMHVIRLTMPVFRGDEYEGQLVLSIDLLGVRDLLSLYASDRSPLHLAPQNPDLKKSFVFDLSGWMLFESAHPRDESDPAGPLAVDSLRAGLKGDVGRPGFQEAFRPDSDYHQYWTAVSRVQAGQAGQMRTSDLFGKPASGEAALFFSYAPIVFHGRGAGDRIVAGVGCFDDSAALNAARERVAGTLSAILAATFFILVLALGFLGRRITRVLERMTRELDKRLHADDNSPFGFYSPYAELSSFQQSINILLMQLHSARRELRRRDLTDADERLRQPVNLDRLIDENPALNRDMAAHPLHGMVGAGPAMAGVRRQIRRAAGVLADVLIIGETGTGKELTAGAVHALSHRAKGPFVSISCGALDENLLMDALFGHVRGAFSEAHGDRKGAFLAASGGTLMLDEIGNASAKVQQALLRALSVRRIVPLGSDREIAFDARVIAATNADLRQAASAPDSGFRDDLYYRLAVLTINTPPLRERKEDLPLLIRHFLDKDCRRRNRPLIAVSRGALDKLSQHDWPGNVRELEHCLIRSMAFVEGDLLLAEHILFNEPAQVRDHPSAAVLEEPGAPAAGAGSIAGVAADALSGLNVRQTAMWPVILRQGGISRGEYQEALAKLGEGVSVRTAQYDLYDLVDRGLLRKTGRGPSSRYVLAGPVE